MLLTIDVNTGAAAASVGPLGSAGRRRFRPRVSASGVLYGAAYRDGQADQLVTIDIMTGAATLVGPLGTNVPTPAVGGLEFDPASGILYYSDNTNLYSVNTSSGAALLIGPHGVAPMAGLAAVVPEVHGMAVAALGVAAALRRRR